MTTTDPMPALRGSFASIERMAVLARMGAPDNGIRHRMPTADAVVDTERGVLFIACDPDPDPGDWATICMVISSVCYDNGMWPSRRDPGEPEWDALAGVCTWRLEYA